MSHIIKDDAGNDVTVFTAEEVEAAKKAEADRIQAEADAKIAENEKHLKEKTDEFLKGKTAQELKDIERDRKIEEARLAAEAANKTAAEAEARRISSIKKSSMEQFVGNDPELTAKFEEAWGLVNLEIKEDSDIARKAEMVANMIGLNQTPPGMVGMPMGGGGGSAPRLNEQEKKNKEAEHTKFVDALGMGDFIPKTEDKK